MKLGKVTATMLEEEGAQCGEVATFRKEWPDGAEATLDNVNRAVELRLDIDWFASHFLAAPALEAYKEARATAWETYLKATAPALESYAKAAASVRKACDRTFDTTWEAYMKARAPALYEA